ncbi:MAG: PilZ domain-containing protein [Myxococcota bacterium]
MSNARSKEHRRDPRVAAEIDVILKFPTGEQRHSTHNISYRGIYIVSPKPPPLRKLLRIQANAEGYDEPLQLLGVVAHRVNQSDAQEHGITPGMGLQIFAMGPETATRWRHLVRAVYEQDPELCHDLRRQEYPLVRIRFADKISMRSFIDKGVASSSVFVRSADLHPQGKRIFLEVVHPATKNTCALEAIVTEFIEAPRQTRGMRVMFPDADQARDTLDRFFNEGVA